MIQPINTGDTQEIRDSKGRFVKGVSGNPCGPKPGYHLHAFVELQNAVKEYKNKEGYGYWTAAALIGIRLAKKGNVTLLCKIIDKFIPNKTEMPEDGDFQGILPIIKLYADGRN